MTQAALDIRNLRITYPRQDEEAFVAVDDVSLTIRPGEIHAVVGESGAGKSTVANAIIGLIDRPGRIDHGAIEVAGKPLGAPENGAVLGRDVGVIFQDPMTSLNPLFTVESQLCEGMRFHLGLTAEEARSRALSLMQAVGIAEPERRLRTYPHQLSGGQRQRAAIARALLGEPRLLLMDEPFGALDEITRDRLNDELLNLWRRTGATILFVTHSIAEAVYLGDRIIVLAANPGRVVKDVDLRPLKQDGNRCSREDPAIVAMMAEMRAALEAAS